ncbi:hypothetical protein BEP19_11535 [Ammoniphilus oxalaticus]|uniref:serine-type D-Ala-D-Ala carboxypeptidase n=1 Tax=Ammoniphilus oxalaticus TaxID=66863 RepID=A0A419SGF1_9BACL|nr:D-alanyl-D-alanine carboxypeptidase family protein [Ammoniphilus oxalaticus]RKD22863.1 hypothetical protein BEP19_11535 [Ammoniphilus oxalaticus]
MNGSRKWIASVLSFTLLFLFTIIPGNRTEAAPSGINLEVRSAIMIEATTGRILYKMNEDVALPPASMTKMMTELLVMEYIEEGKISWDDPVQTSEYGHYMGKYGGSRVFLAMGEVRTVRELYEAMAIYSANDATVMLAEHIAGTEENFVKMMNQKAVEIGMEHSHFLTSSGYPASELGEYRPNIEGDHVMSAKDSAILAREIINKYPEALEISKIPKKVFREGEANSLMMPNWNWMLPGLVYHFDGVDGLKTGHTNEAKYCFTGTGVRNGMRVITVVMGAESEAKRFGETRKLMTYGFNNYSLETLTPKGQPIEGAEEATVKKGKRLNVAVAPEKDVVFPLHTNEKDQYEVAVQLEEVIAPIEKGQPIGKVTVQYTGEDDPVEYISSEDEGAAVNLVAEADVDKASWIRLFFRAIKNFIGGIFGGIVDKITGLF